MQSHNDPQGRDEDAEPRAAELYEKRNAKRMERNRLVTGVNDADQMPGGNRRRRGWPYRGFIVCVG